MAVLHPGLGRGDRRSVRAPAQRGRPRAPRRRGIPLPARGSARRYGRRADRRAVIDTVLGPVDRLPDGIIDAHAHVWIDGVEGTSSGGTFVLADGPAITEELRA